VKEDSPHRRTAKTLFYGGNHDREELRSLRHGSCEVLLKARRWFFIGLGVFLCAELPARAEGIDSPPTSTWHYGAYLDLSYAIDFNFPDNHRWRSKSTTTHVNQLAPNMVRVYVQKDAVPQSRWGGELALQDGYDTDRLVPERNAAGDKPIDGADTLRHVSRANVSYLAPVGNGLSLTAGLFNSYIGYQSFYAGSNLNYTRSYLADNSPYFMFGVAASYQFSEALKAGLYVINGYSYLSHPNDQPSYGAQVVWKPVSRWTLIQNLYYGPDQSSTSLKFWRLFSDSIMEWKGDRLTLALAYDIGTEQAVEQTGNPRTFWTGGAFFARWNVSGPWSLAVRPELYWDRNGRLTGSEQLLKAISNTVEYRLYYCAQTMIARLEYRYDQSTGVGGGFFKDGNTGTVGLARDQQLLILALIWAYDS